MSLKLLDTDELNVSFHAYKGTLLCYYGEKFQYCIQYVLDLQVDDRMQTPQGHIDLSETTRKVIEAFFVAINERMFRLDTEGVRMNNVILASPKTIQVISTYQW